MRNLNNNNKKDKGALIAHLVFLCLSFCYVLWAGLTVNVWRIPPELFSLAGTAEHGGWGDGGGGGGHGPPNIFKIIGSK